MRERIIELDVRDDLRRGREPFSKIMLTVAQLKAEESLRLLAPFEPKPLFAVLAQQGFSYVSKALDSGDFEVLFSRHAASLKEHAPAGRDAAQSSPPAIVELDARGLEPPQPMVKILEAVETLPIHAQLHAHTDRRPMHLYAQLEARGFTAHSEEQSDGTFITHVRRK
ncbi:MAG: DUF2249 domain-containing protein [Verrucomicrobiae bacterium]|nr:DUF2249 domain-containing protein [Verrucomicrobiae bacterium]